MNQLGPLSDAVATTVNELADQRAVERLWEGDFTLWQSDPTEITNRLGWLRVADELLADADSILSFADGLAADGITHVVVMGMGGSSLFPEVLARTFPPVAGRPELRILDTTDPAAVVRVSHECPGDSTLFIASSKSGSTVETRSHLATFWAAVGDGQHFAVITDAGSDLQELAEQRNFRAVFENNPDIGGRYAALSHFGMVPGAVAGVDFRGILSSAQQMARRLGPDVPIADNPGAQLGAVLAAGAKTGRDKVTLVIDPEIETFGLWLEQLLAESTGKHGTGVIPIAGERLGPPEVYGDDRLFVAIGEHHGLEVLADAGHPVVNLDYSDPLDLGGLVLQWEVATAICGAALGINPFDQPNVAEAKAASNKVLEEGLPEVEITPIDDLLSQVKPGDYLSIQAYVDPEAGVVDAIEDARTALRDRLKVATTVGLGPRFLHSTGQLHKGGPPSGVFVQVVGNDPVDLEIPDATYSFSTLKQAQAAGDLATLRDHDLRAARVSIDDLLDQTR